MNPLFAGKALDFVFESGKTLIDRLFPDKEKQATERALALAQLDQMTSETELKKGAQQLSAILAEAQSADPWTSRARPSFLYVIYVMILMSIPMGFLSAWKPEVAAAVAQGMKLWLAAIPDSLWALFGAGYLGYAVTRSWDKKTEAKASQ